MVDIGSPNGYVRGRGTLHKVREAGEVQLVFQASNLRNERSGFHAKVEILANGACVAYNTFNVERDADRVTLSNSAYRQLAPSKNQEMPGYPPKYLKNDLDQFCGGLQEAFIETLMPRPMRGSLERHEPVFVLRPYILLGSGTILFAPPGQGKSYVMWTMAVCIDAGITTLWPVRQARVLVVNLERPERSVADRLGNINEVLGLDRSRPIHTMNARGKTLETMAPAIQRYADAEGIGCIMVDSLSRAGRGSLNDDDVVNAYCDLLNGFGPSWLALAHSPRSDPTHVFGSQMFDAAADLMVRLTQQSRMSGLMGVSLDLTKRNDLPRQPLWVGAFDFDVGGVKTIRRALAGEFPALEGSEKLPDEEMIARYLLRVGACSPTDIAVELHMNRTVVSDLLNRNPKRFEVKKNEGHKRLWGIASNSSGNSSAAATVQQQLEEAELPF